MTNYLAFMMGGLGPWEVGVIAVIALLIFGRKLPEMGRSLGRSIVEFKRGVSGMADELDSIEPPKDTTDKKRS